MNDTFRLGRIRGVRVGVNWTVLVVFALVAYGLAAERLPRAYKGMPAGAYVLAGLATALVFLASLLLHELAHAIVARRNGLTVQGITLWLLGGVARFEGDPPSPGAEMRIAGAGPLVSAILGAIFAAAAQSLAWAGGDGLAAGCLAWLGVINTILAVFNVIPAAPLDGGRLLRAFLWRRSGDRTRAALRSAQVGRLFGWVLMVAGFYLSLWNLSGLWLAFLGWFLLLAAGMEAGQANLRARLDGVPVGRIMTPAPFTVPASMTVAQFRDETLRRHRHSAYPVLDGDTVRGLLRAEQTRQAPPQAPVGALDLEEVRRTGPENPVTDLLTELATTRHLVFDGDRLIGIVTPRDLTRELERLNHRPAI